MLGCGLLCSSWWLALWISSVKKHVKKKRNVVNVKKFNHLKIGIVEKFWCPLCFYRLGTVPFFAVKYFRPFLSIIYVYLSANKFLAIDLKKKRATLDQIFPIYFFFLILILNLEIWKIKFKKFETKKWIENFERSKNKYKK